MDGSSFTCNISSKRCKESKGKLCWLEVEGHHNKKFTLSAVKDLTYEVSGERTSRDKIEDLSWIADNLQEEYIEKFTFMLKENQMSHQDQMAATSVVMENRNNTIQLY